MHTMVISGNAVAGISGHRALPRRQSVVCAMESERQRTHHIDDA